MPLTYINHDGSLSKEVLSKLGEQFNVINQELTGLGMNEVFYFTQKYEDPCKAEPVEVFIRLSERASPKKSEEDHLMQIWLLRKLKSLKS